jgi:hypothetical protein
VLSKNNSKKRKFPEFLNNLVDITKPDGRQKIEIEVEDVDNPLVFIPASRSKSKSKPTSRSARKTMMLSKQKLVK